MNELEKASYTNIGGFIMRKKMFSLLLAFFIFVIHAQAKDVLLGGESVGIELHYDGLLIISTYQFENEGKTYDPAVRDILSGDTLISINEKNIETIDELNQILEKNVDSIVTCAILRNGKTIHRNLDVVKENGKIKTGLFVKDEITGIGTLTFIDPENDHFASLGHEIIDSDTKQIILLEDGILFSSNVISIQKAQVSRVGEKEALIHFDEPLGNIETVSRYGIYGTITKQLNNRKISTAYQNEIQLGEAYIYTVIEEQKIEPIKIEITKKYFQKEMDIKSFEFNMIDQDTLERTGGIVQGMSGSPIVQNGKLIGAVTHVSSSNPSNGYGIYIEWMLKQSDLNRQ